MTCFSHVPVGRSQYYIVFCSIETCFQPDKASILFLATNSLEASLCASIAKEAAVLVVDVLVGVDGERRAEAAEEEEEDEEDTTENNELSHSGVSDTVVCPGAAGTSSVVLELVGAELVVNETGESDRVTEELEGSNGVVEDEHRGNDEENVLEDTAKSEDERRGSTNL